MKLLCFVFCFVSSCCSAVVFVADASSKTGANQIGPIRIPKSKGTIEKRNASERPTSVDDLFQPFPRTSSQMQILNVQNFCASASHKCDFVLNQAKHKVSTTNCFGNAWAPRYCPNRSLFTSASSTHRPLFLALTDSALPTCKRLRLQTPARWLQDQPPLLSALQ